MKTMTMKMKMTFSLARLLSMKSTGSSPIFLADLGLAVTFAGSAGHVSFAQKSNRATLFLVLSQVMTS
jgi:hypothetical protein